jgi:hypothetical protein
MADLCPEASNAFKLPIFEISILKDEKKSPSISSDFVTNKLDRGTFTRSAAGAGVRFRNNFE